MESFDEVVCGADVVVVFGVVVVVFGGVGGDDVAKVLADVALEFVGC